jgi:hypothetical protein
MTRRLRLAGSEGVSGLLPDGYHYSQTFGGKPKQSTASGVGPRKVSPSRGAHIAPWDDAPASDLRVVDSPLGNSVGAIG